MSNIAVKWNVLDSFIYKIEINIAKLFNAAKESKKDLPDPEEMIAAATEQLQHENEKLKKKEYPGILIKKNNHYYCPDCHELISSELVEQKKKYCPGCGKRIIVSTVSKYATSNNEPLN